MNKKDLKQEIDLQGNVLHALMCITFGVHQLCEALEDRCADISLSLQSDVGGCDDDL